MQVHVGHLAVGGFPLPEGDAGEASLDEVILAGRLALAHPLGELALSDVETDGTVVGITGAGESGVVTHGFVGFKWLRKNGIWLFD
jgi:hypothetical protein